MGPKVRLLSWFLTVLCFGYNFYVWGGLKDTPLISQQLMKEAPFGSPLAATYMVFGQKINGTIGRTDEGREFAAREFPELVAHPELVENLAVRRFLSAQSALGSACYYLAPILLVLSFVLHAMRQKKIRSMGGVDS